MKWVILPADGSAVRRNPISSHHVTGRTAAGHCLENESFIKNLRYPRNQIGPELEACFLVANVYSTKSFVQAVGKKTTELSAMVAKCQLVHQDMISCVIVPQLYWTNQLLYNWITDFLRGWGTHLVLYTSSKTYDCGGYGPKRINMLLLFH